METEDPRAILNEVKTFMNAVRYLRAREPVCKVRVSKSLKKIRVSNIENIENHYAVFDLRKNGFHVEEHSLPDSCVFKSPCSIEGLMSEFHGMLASLTSFYSNLQAIDISCLVVAPENICTKDTFRIVKYEDRIYLKITVDPKAPEEVNVKFIGPSELVGQVVNRTSSAGDFEEDVSRFELEGSRSFLRRVLNEVGREFFLEHEEAMLTEVPCSICLSFRDDSGDWPLFSCGSAACVGKFHESCLTEYTKTSGDKKTFVDLTSFACFMPFCKGKVQLVSF